MFEIICSVSFAVFILAITAPLFFDGIGDFLEQLRENTFLLALWFLFDSLFDVFYSIADFFRFLLWTIIGIISGLLFYSAVF